MSVNFQSCAASFYDIVHGDLDTKCSVETISLFPYPLSQIPSLNTMPIFTHAIYEQTPNLVSAGKVAVLREAPTEILGKTRHDTLPEEHDVEVACTMAPFQALNTKIRASNH